MTKHDLLGQCSIARFEPVVAFTVPGRPVGKGRPRAVTRGKFVRMYTPEKTVSYESTVALAASEAMAGMPPIEGPVEVVMNMVLPIPKSWSKRKQQQALDGLLLPTTKPDKDNVIKAIFDAVNNIVWLDDVQVADLVSKKRYGAVPGVRVIVSKLEV